MILEDLKAAFADDEDILTFEDEGNYFTVKMEYQPGSLGKAKWDAINNQIKEFGGEWVSAGRMSHWKVPKNQPEITDLEAPDPYTRMDNIIKSLQKAWEEIKAS